MKKLFLLFTLAFVAMSCEMIDEKLDDLLDKRDWVVFAEGTELTANVPSKQTVLNYKFESTLDWEVKTDAKWLEIDPMSGKAGKDIKIQIKVAKNKDKEGRTGYANLTLSNNESYRITINQAGEGDENEENDEGDENDEGTIVDIPANQIWYTSVDGEIVEPYSGEYNEYADAITTFGVNIVSNTYVDGKGVIEFDGDVTEIGLGAFYDCNGLTSVILPNSVIVIKKGAFYGCINLNSVNIPDGVYEIGFDAFCGCTAIRTVTIPESVSFIDDGAFVVCNSMERFNGKFASEDGRCIIIDGVLKAFAPAGLTEYTIPDNVTKIGHAVFLRYSNLENIIIPDSVTDIDNWAFQDCTSLTSVTIPDSVTTIGYATFYNCGSLTSATIGDSVTTIRYATFYNCGSLTSVTIGDSVTTIGDYAFNSCSSLESLTIGDSVTSIGDYAFCGCGSLTSVTIPDSVTSIGNYAFFFCESLTSVIIGDSVTTIGICAFGKCDSLTSVTIGDSVTTIGEGAFGECDSLTSVTIGDSVTTIGEGAFANCSSLTNITIPDSVTKLGRGAFSSCSSLTSVTIPDSVTTIGDTAFFACSSLTSVTIGDSVISIGEWAFLGCSSLTSVTIPDSVTSIGDGAFVVCNSMERFNGKYASEDGRCLIIDGTLNSFAPAGLSEYNIPDSVTEIGAHAFDGCYSLTSITIPDSVTTIGEYAFCGCSSLTSVTIPDSVTTIGNYAFLSCSSLTSVYCKATTPPAGDSNMFYMNASDRKIYVPMESVEAYKSASGWSDYADAIVGFEFGNGEVVVPDTDPSKPANNEIWYTNGSTSQPIIFPHGNLYDVFNLNIVSHTYNTEKGCWVIKCDGDITEITPEAFRYQKLISITLPESLIVLNEFAFQNCSELTSITLPESLTALTLSNFVFHNCSKLTSITLPKNVVGIGSFAFDGCTNLMRVYCESTNPPRGGESMFDKSVFGRKIYVPIGSKDSYQSAKSWNDYKYEIAGYDENYSKYHIGDIVSVDGAVGIVYEIVDGNVKVVSVEETSTSWGEYGVEVRTYDRYYGYNNMLVVQSMEDWKDKYPAFKWCADFGDGWYLPSIQELFDIYFVKNTLNEILVANGYTRLGSDNGSMQHYWSSTHSDGGNAEMLRDEGNGSYSWVADEKFRNYRVRAVRVL